MIQTKRTLRSSGARGLDVSRCYRHIAPLERKAPTHQNSRRGIPRRGLVSSSNGLGNPTPTNSIPLGLNTPMDSPLLTFPLSHFLPFSLSWLCLPRFLSVLISVNLRPYFPKNLKPAMCPYRFIRSILVGDLPINSFFRFEPKNPAICVKFFTKKLLTDDYICCIIGCLKL